MEKSFLTATTQSLGPNGFTDCPTQRQTQVQESAGFLDSVLAELDKKLDSLGTRLMSVRCSKPQPVSASSKDNLMVKAPIADYLDSCGKRVQSMIGKVSYFMDELEI